ncbi:MAG: Holliday junction resolvase RuvX [Chloroflexota bacterium]|nr:Holliday junction resolvase RuvX [Chloroflexota bacterium]
MSRILALDHGAKRIGVAVADLETGMAFARSAIQRRNLDHDLALVRELCTAEGVERVVIGLPLNMDGTEGPQSEAAREFGAHLADAGLHVIYEDERLSSWEAAQRLHASGHRPTRASGELDSTAARVILQQYLDARHRPGPPAEETE